MPLSPLLVSISSPYYQTNFLHYLPVLPLTLLAAAPPSFLNTPSSPPPSPLQNICIQPEFKQPKIYTKISIVKNKSLALFLRHTKHFKSLSYFLSPLSLSYFLSPLSLSSCFLSPLTYVFTYLGQFQFPWSIKSLPSVSSSAIAHV